MYRFTALKSGIIFSLSLAGTGLLSHGQTVDEILVVGTTPAADLGLAASKIPFNVQSVSSTDLDNAQSLDLADYLNSNFSSVSINAAQNNPLQPDVQYRGFTASPLLGLPQGVAVYQDGVRLNEPLGDAVNWDLLPESAIASMTVLSGANPVFGLNALGGAINIRMKNGFNYTGRDLELSSGDWGRQIGSFQIGNNNGNWGFYANVSYFEEDGWRDLSPSQALNLYGNVSWRQGETTAVDLALQLGDSELHGNGAAPIGLLKVDRNAVFTAPDITENQLQMVSLSMRHQFSADIALSGVAYRRENDTDSFNGDGSEFELCEFSGGAQALLQEVDDIEDALEDELDVELDAICAGESPTITNFDQLQALISQQTTLVGLDPEDFELEDVIDDISGTGVLSDQGINNISTRVQTSEGLEGQLTLSGDLLQRNNRLVVGVSYFSGASNFNSVSELSFLDPVSRSTWGLGTGSFFDPAATNIATRTSTWGVYFSDTLDVSEKLALTVSGRFNDSKVRLRDRSGVRPELNGDHAYSRFNPAIGITYQFNSAANGYLAYNESNRIPTPIELSCNDAIFSAAQARAIAEGEDPDEVEFECRLPNAFLADPPLDDVVTRNIEAGLRGEINGMGYNISVYSAVNRDDILFQTTGRATGLFANVDGTRRRGFESSFRGGVGNWRWNAAYSFVDASFDDAFMVLSPNHPFADEEGNIAVTRGDRLPGIPRHLLKLGADYDWNQALTIGFEAIFNSSQYLRGDESNQLDEIKGYSLINLRAVYQVNQSLGIFARVTNLLDKRYENFGLLGENPEEILDSLQDLRPLFLGAGAPRGMWVGLRYSF